MLVKRLPTAISFFMFRIVVHLLHFQFRLSKNTLDFAYLCLSLFSFYHIISMCQCNFFTFQNLLLNIKKDYDELVFARDIQMNIEKLT